MTQKKVSVIVPVYNDPEGLAATLGSLVVQEYLKSDLEIIIADNGSLDATMNVIEEYTRRYPHLVRCVREDRARSSYAARNRGLEAATGELISFVDADMTVGPDWLKTVAGIFDDTGPDYLGCRVRVYSNRKSVAALYNVLTGFPVKRYMEVHHFAPTCCLTVRRRVIDMVGGFDGRLRSGGDTEFGSRAWDSGLQFHYAAGIVMHHPARETLAALLSKAVRVGRYGRGGVARLYPQRYGHLKRHYLSLRNYLPKRPWTIRRSYRCGYSFKNWTVLLLSVLPMLIQLFSVAGFLRSWMGYLSHRRDPKGVV